MMTVKPAGGRGHADHGWLDTYHSFSFADYYDPRQMGFRSLRVINEDRVAPGRGFGTHSHRDMEIITYVLEGALEHRDSMGNGSVIRPGDVQRMTAGTGVAHSEYNASSTEPVHFLQIWIFPERNGLEPGYEEKNFPEEERRGRFRPIASPTGEEGAVKIHQDVVLSAALLAVGETVERKIGQGRHAWLQVARGKVSLGESVLSAGDAVAISDEDRVVVTGIDTAEVLLFDLA